MKTSSSRKARNNKVYTAKGPRDRRIRLSADIAIQFYDIQDRLGYERATEAIDWLISKAKGSIDKLFDNSFQHEFKHLTNLGAHNSTFQGDYIEGSVSGREDLCVQGDCLLKNIPGGQDYCIDNSMFNPCIQVANGLQDQCAAHSIFSSPLILANCNMPCFQQIDEKGQNTRMINFNSKMNSNIGENPLMLNSVPLFLQQPVTDHNINSPLAHTPPSDPELNLCLPGNCTSTFTDSEHLSIF